MQPASSPIAVLKLMELEVKYLRVAKTYQAKKKRLEAMFRDQSESYNLFFNHMLPDFKAAAPTTELPWMAPPGELENTLQKFLDENDPTKTK